VHQVVCSSVLFPPFLFLPSLSDPSHACFSLTMLYRSYFPACHLEINTHCIQHELCPLQIPSFPFSLPTKLVTLPGFDKWKNNNVFNFHKNLDLLDTYFINNTRTFQDKLLKKPTF
jgi:hypothetical protein